MQALTLHDLASVLAHISEQMLSNCTFPAIVNDCFFHRVLMTGNIHGCFTHGQDLKSAHTRSVQVSVSGNTVTIVHTIDPLISLQLVCDIVS